MFLEGHAAHMKEDNLGADLSKEFENFNQLNKKCAERINSNLRREQQNLRVNDPVLSKDDVESDKSSDEVFSSSDQDSSSDANGGDKSDSEAENERMEKVI